MNVKLTDLDAVLVRATMIAGQQGHVECDHLPAADGVLFVCPKCGKHSVLIWFKGVPDYCTPGPGRWAKSGTGVGDLTLDPSVDLSGSPGCKWHGFVRNGICTE